jgi:hypothetical protein
MSRLSEFKTPFKTDTVRDPTESAFLNPSTQKQAQWRATHRGNKNPMRLPYQINDGRDVDARHATVARTDFTIQIRGMDIDADAD